MRFTFIYYYSFHRFRTLPILRILLTDAAIEESDEVEAGVIFDYDNQGNVVGIEILDASKRNTQTRQLEYSA